MTKQAIIDEIELRTSSKYTTWRIGLANDPDHRRQDCERDGERTDFWMDWRADTMDDAKDIENRFNNRGMKLIPAEKLSPGKSVFVFIF